MGLSERIRRQGEGLKLRQAAEDVVAWPFYGSGWVLGKVWWLVWFCVSAVVLGFREGSGE